MANFPQTIQIPATVLEIVEWLERTDRELSFVSDGKHTAYLSWIEKGPMGMRIGSYVPGPYPIKIAFEGYVTVVQGEPDVLLPFHPSVTETEFRDLDGFMILTARDQRPGILDPS